MGKALEAKVIVSAEDRTKAVFDGIMRRYEGIFKTAEAVDKAAARSRSTLDRVGPSLDRIGQSLALAAERLDKSARAIERASKAAGAAGGHSGRGGLGHQWLAAAEHIGTDRGGRHAAMATGASLPIIGGPATAVAGVVAYEGGKFVAEKRGERVHEQVREDISGMAPEEREAAEKHTARLAAKFPQVDQTSILHTLRNARATTGSYAQAADLAEDLIKMRIVAQAAKPDRDLEHETDLLTKAMELHGDTMNPAAFHTAMRRINKVLAVEGDTLSPADIYMSAQYSRQALPTTSQRFMYGVAPGVAQEMKGNSFGVGLAAFNRAIVSGRTDGHALRTAVELGLIEKDDVVLNKKGEPVRVKSTLEGGHGFKDAKLAATDPDLYIYGRILKALDEHGIKDPTQRDQIIGDLFSKSMAANLVSKFIDQRDRIQKNSDNFARAPDDPAERIMAGDPIAAWRGVENSFTNLAAAIPVSGTAVTGALNTVAAAINDQAARMQGVKTDHARLVENKETYGIASGQDLTKLAPAELAPLKDAAVAELKQHLLAAKLELKGVRDEESAQARMGWGEYLVSGRDKVADAMLPFRDKNLSKEIAEIEAVIARLGHLGEVLPPPSPQAALGDPERDRALRYGSGGATLGGVRENLAASLAGKIEATVKPDQISAKVEGQVQGNVTVTVTASPELKATIAAAKGGSDKQFQMNVGTSAPGTSPAGRTAGGR